MAVATSSQAGPNGPACIHYRKLNEKWIWAIPSQFLPEVQEILAGVPERLVRIQIDGDVILISHNFSPKDFKRKAFGVSAYHECHQKYGGLYRKEGGQWIQRKEKPVPKAKQLHVLGYDFGFVRSGVFVRVPNPDFSMYHA